MSANFTAILLALDQGKRRRARCYRVAFYAMKSSLALFLVVLLVDCLWPRAACVKSPTRVASKDVIDVAKAIEHLRLRHGDRCPWDLGELKTAGVIGRVPKDPWGRSFIIECSGPFIRVCSRGQDEVDPEDDVCHEERPYEPTSMGVQPGVREPDAGQDMANRRTKGSWHGR